MPDLPTAQPPSPPLVDDAAAAAAAAHLRARLDQDDAGALDPDLHAHGVALAAHRMERGAPGFYAVALSIAAELRADPGRLRRFLRAWYEGARDLLEDHDRMPAGVDGPDAVRAALRAISGAPDAPAPDPTPEPTPDLADDAAPPEPAEGWDAALTRAERTAARPAPTPLPPPGGYAPPAAALASAPIDSGAPKAGRKRSGYRFSDLLWGAFFVPVVLVGLVAFLYLLVLPPMSYITGLTAWQVRELTYAAMLGIALWMSNLALLFPPVWYAWRRGRRGWIWPLLAAPPTLAVLVFMSTLIVLRSPMHPDFLSGAMDWAGLWGPVTIAVAGSIAFGSRLRGLSRRIFRRIGRYWDGVHGVAPRR